MNNRIIISDILYPEGHNALTSKWVSILSESFNITLVGKKNYYEGIRKEIPEIPVIHVRQSFFKRVEFLKTLSVVINLIRVAFAVRRINYDKIVFLSTHNAALYFAYRFFKKGSIVVVHHYDIDRTMSLPWETRIFKKYANKIHHVVLAEFIADGLSENFMIDRDLIHVVYQPIIRKSENKSLLKRNDRFILLGRKNSEKCVKELIELDKSFNEKNKYQFLVRAKNISYSSENVEIFDKFMSYDEYCSLLDTNVACVVIYPDTYRYRYSGVMDDAISHGLYILCYDIPVGRYFKSQCPNNVRLFADTEELWKLASCNLPIIEEKEYEIFLESHSDSCVLDQWISVLR